MNKNAIKKFAIEARKKLIDSVTDKAGMLGITEKSCSEPVTRGTDFEVYQTIAGTEITLNRRQCEQRRRLVSQIESRGFEAVVEEVAYTWFNRICAIRFMEVNDYLPNRVRVLSSEKEGKMEPDLVTQAPDVDLDLTAQEKEEIINWKMSGTSEDTDKLYCKLFLKQCHQLQDILPGLFEADSDYMELLFGISYTNKDDVIYMLVNPETGIPEADFNVSTLDEEGNPTGQVEIIGWLYQYYNTELKDDTFAKLKKNVKITKERIPAATQLFTPDWIVRYMVENSVGRIWIEHLRAVDPSIDEKATAERFGWKYYLPEAEQEESVNVKLAEIRTTYRDLKPTDITCIDPCMGSGHILIAMFDVLMDIYESAGYDKREAVFEIVEHNIHGLDIDQRAYQLLCGGIWCILQMEYEFIEEDKKNTQPIRIRKLTPIQMPHVDMDEVKNGRKAFTKDEWMDILLRSTGLEPERFSERAKWLLIARMIPLVENNFNLCELGPRSTGKSYIYEQISPNSILVAGGQTTVANLFYNMSNHTVGLVGMWDCVAFDEVAGIKFKDKDGIQIMKGYMASGAFSRGKAEIQAKASMVFVGNINQSVETLLKTSSLFDPFPSEMGTDTAFLDRMHCYIPGWEIPKYRPDSFTNDYGFITDYLSEFMRELRKDSYSDLMDKYFRLGNNLNQRDTIAVRKMISGFTKLLYPDGEVTKEELREIVEISLELRRRVKEQLKKIGGMEFYDVNFSYTDNDSFEEHYVSVPEQGGGKLIPEGMGKPGSVYTVSKSKTGMIGCYMLETQMMPGNGKLTCTGIGAGKEPKEATNTAFNYLKANGNRISGLISTTTKDYIINYQDMQGIGMTGNLALPTLIAICSAALGKTPLNSLAILGEISIGGTLIKVDELASTLQVCLDSGAKKVLLPITSAGDLGTVPSDLVGAFSLIFYSSVEEAVFKALGVE